MSKITAVVLATLILASTQAFAQTNVSPLVPSLRLTIDEAVNLALEHNLGIKFQRVDPQIRDVGIAQARSLWAPQLTSSLSSTNQTQAATSFLSGGASSIGSGQVTTGLGLSQQLPWGGSYSATWNNARFTTTNLFTNFNPQLTSTMTLNYTQPLLRNYSIDQIREQVALSRKARELSDVQLNAVIVQTTRNVKNAYWDLVSALENLKAQQASLGLAQQSLTDTEDRVEIGTQAPIDIVQAKAEVASNEAGVITADAAIQRAQDQLRALVLDPAAPDFWTTAIEPLDPGTFDERAVDVGAAVRNALDKRSDLRQAKNSLEQNNINLRYLKDQLLPDVSAQVNYSATGVGGSQLSPINGLNLGAARSVVGDYGFGSVVGDLLRSAYPTWTAGVQISYPLGTSAAKANFARSRLEYEQGQIELRNLELQVATQVRDVARSVQTNQQRVQSTRANRDLQEQKLAAEEQKLTAGSSSNFFVYQAQRDLAQARSQEIQAMTDYNKSVVDLEAVQAAPLR